MFQQFLSNSLLQISQANHCVFSVYLAYFLVAFWNLLPRILAEGTGHRALGPTLSWTYPLKTCTCLSVLSQAGPSYENGDMVSTTNSCFYHDPVTVYGVNLPGRDAHPGMSPKP